MPRTSLMMRTPDEGHRAVPSVQEGCRPGADYFSASSTLLTKSVMTSFAWGSTTTTADGCAAMLRLVSFSLRILTILDGSKPAVPHDSTTSNSLIASRESRQKTTSCLCNNGRANGRESAAFIASTEAAAVLPLRRPVAPDGIVSLSFFRCQMACRHVVRDPRTVVSLARRPVLFALARTLGEAWPRVPLGNKALGC
jgi:hypothetical protein